MNANRIVIGMCALALAAGTAVAELPKLDKLDEAVAKCKATLADQKAGASAKAAAQVRLYEIEILTGPDAAYEAKRKELENYLTHPIAGMSPAAQIDFLKNLYRQRLKVRLPSDYALAEAFVKNLGDAGKALEATMVCYRISNMRSASGSLAKETSHEARLEAIDAALKHPALARDPNRMWLTQRRFEALADLGRDTDAEVYGLALQAAATNRYQKLEYSRMLAKFYRDRARRYCSAPDPTTLHKAADQYRRHKAVSEDARMSEEDLEDVAKCLREAGDAKGALAALAEAETFVPRLGEARTRIARFSIVVQRGDIAFDAGDYAEALRVWDPVAKSFITEGGREPARLERYCRALKAAGRADEMMPYMEALSKRGNKYTRLRYEYLLGNMKAEAAAAKKQ